jgi:hypothetical protein
LSVQRRVEVWNMVGLQLILILWILFHSLAQAWSSEDDGDLLSFVTVSIPAH